MSAESESVYLGLDLSTQHLKAIVVSSTLSVVAEAAVDFDRVFASRYGVTAGVLVGPDGQVQAPVAMWLDALDLVLGRLADTGLSLHRISAICGACQQHGSVYWGSEADLLLQALDPAQSLAQQLAPALAHPFAPNWQDHSTADEAASFNAALGSADRLAAVTGSSAQLRFTGPQIMRFRRQFSQRYNATTRISLVSSFLASVLLGRVAPLDIADVCGMNLWDICARAWSDALLVLTAGGPNGVEALRRRLGDVRCDGGGALGPVSPYFVAKYGFGASCQIAPFTGDNPASLLALPLRPLDAVVSLGTSTTFLTVTSRYRPHPSCHVFNHPTSPGLYMYLLCFKNGGLARERIRDSLPIPAGADPWATFSRLVLQSAPLNMSPGSGTAALGLYFLRPEIEPNVGAGTWRFNCRPDGSGLSVSRGWPAEQDARAVVESQMLSVRLRARHLVDATDPGLPEQPRRIYLVGGGSANEAIAQVVGDVLGGTDGVYKLDAEANGCALGGAYKALWAVERQGGQGFEDFIANKWKGKVAITRLHDGYNPRTFELYGSVIPAFEQMEQQVISEGSDGHLL